MSRRIDLVGIETEVALAQCALEGMATVAEECLLPSINRMRGNLAAARHALRLAQGVAATEPAPDSGVQIGGK